MERIGTVSEAARVASRCTALFNIRPLTQLPFSTERPNPDDVQFHSMHWLRGSFPLQLVLNILEDAVLVETRSDAAVLPDD